MLAAYAGAAAVPGGAHAAERVGLSQTTPGGSGSRPANEQSSSPDELQKDLRLRVQQDHPVDIIISDRDRFVFVDNVKAASTTLRELLSKHLNVTWWDGCDGVYRQCCSTLGRTTTACLDEQHASYFVFGFARHPAVKFESGAPVVGCGLADGASRAGLPMAGVAACPFPRLPARLPTCSGVPWVAPAWLTICSSAAGCLPWASWRQAACGRAHAYALRFLPTGVREAWLQSRELSQFSADELLARQLNSGTFVNEHLQPSSYRFSGRTGLGTPVRMDLVGKVESITADMRRIAAAHCSRLRQEDCSRLRQEDCSRLPPPVCPLDPVAAAVGQLWQNRHPDLGERSVLSARGLQRFCLSEVYQADAELYGYDCLDRPPSNAAARVKAEPAPAPEVEAEGAAEQGGWPITAAPAGEVESGMGPEPPGRRDSAFAGAFAGWGRGGSSAEGRLTFLIVP